MKDSMRGRVAIVTGGAQGIGRSTCELLLEQGAFVVIADVSEERGVATEHELSRRGDCIFVRTEIADESSIENAVAVTAARFGRPDFLVNNASAFVMRGLDASVQEWRRMLEVNVMGTALFMKHVAPHMKQLGGGAIVNMSSISAFIAQEGLLTYNTTKGAISSMTRLAAMELAPYGIRVNAVCPATVWSDSNAQIIWRQRRIDRAGADADPDIGGKTMLKRVADPIEIARVVIFLLSSDASYITAENLMVDGGYTAL
jgi:NAD(P)-dependent dehydrogenase (short-subunit alcohol dehydrogenase family)